MEARLESVWDRVRQTSVQQGRAAWEWLRRIHQEFVSEHASLTAAAVALFGLLSLFPLVLLAIAGATYALGSPEEALRQITDVLRRGLVGPASDALVEVVEGVLRSRGLASFFGVLGFLWASSRVFTILIEAFNMAWDVEESRGFFYRNLLAIGLVFLTLAFGLINFVGPLALGFLVRYSDRLTGQLGIPADIAGTWPILVDLGAYVATVAFFFLLYKILPNRRVPTYSALYGAILAATLWEIAKYLFQFYLINFGAYNQIYGTLAGVIVLILWLHYSAIILLLGTVTASVHAARVCGERAGHPRHRGYDEREGEAGQPSR